MRWDRYGNPIYRDTSRHVILAWGMFAFGAAAMVTMVVSILG